MEAGKKNGINIQVCLAGLLEQTGDSAQENITVLEKCTERTEI